MMAKCMPSILPDLSLEEALEVTPEQYHRLMQGLEIVAKRPIAELTDPPKTM